MVPVKLFKNRRTDKAEYIHLMQRYCLDSINITGDMKTR